MGLRELQVWAFGRDRAVKIKVYRWVKELTVEVTVTRRLRTTTYRREWLYIVQGLRKDGSVILKVDKKTGEVEVKVTEKVAALLSIKVKTQGAENGVFQGGAAGNNNLAGLWDKQRESQEGGCWPAKPAEGLVEVVKPRWVGTGKGLF